MLEKLFHRIAVLLMTALLFSFLYVIFVMAPVKLFAQASCLEQGYPKAYTTPWLETYCSNLEGSVTVKVIKQ